MFEGDPKELAEFLVEPVQVETTTIYPVQDYGSAMTPFYSTLAIWVGGVVLGSIFKVHASKDGLRKPKDRHLFWGRFLTYFVLGQLQAAIIVWGDIHLIGCQCIEPKLLYLCAAVTSFVFISIIFSLILAFGDVGKAIVVVIMIVQIAGSSGSYPVEILPEIFTGIYLFFPFPYAINAMREAICGLYQYDIYKYLAELMIFGIFGLLIGLVVKKSFAPVTHFLEEDMEKTGVL
jgi:putative membrane protein